MRGLIAVLMALALGGVGGAILPTLIEGWQAQGPDVRCIQVSGRSVCQGQAVTELPWNWDKRLGGIVSVSCDFERPGKGRESGYLIDIPSIASGCKTPRYVVSLSDGAVLTNFWIDDGRIARIDRYDANPIDL